MILSGRGQCCINFRWTAKYAWVRASGPATIRGPYRSTASTTGIRNKRYRFDIESPYDYSANANSATRMTFVRDGVLTRRRRAGPAALYDHLTQRPLEAALTRGRSAALPLPFAKSFTASVPRVIQYVLDIRNPLPTLRLSKEDRR